MYLAGVAMNAAKIVSNELQLVTIPLTCVPQNGDPIIEEIDNDAKMLAQLYRGTFRLSKPAWDLLFCYLLIPNLFLAN